MNIVKSTVENSKRIAKNSVALYVRMLFSVCISLYTSRVVLEVLGVEDFGTYNVVGGVVALMGFFNTSMAGATSRFLIFDIGKNDISHLKKTFSSVLQIHILIAIAILFIGELVGGWFINSQLEIPAERIVAANWVFQLSLFSAIIGIIQVPYSASIIAHERMDVYAVIEIVHVLLRLVIVYVLLFIHTDKLISYSMLLFCVTFTVFIIYRIYCTYKYEECHLNKRIHKDIIYPILSFSGWDLYGNGCVVARQQGTNILLNQFFGVTLNAASGIATQASSAVSMFVSSLTMAMRPQIIKRYALKDISGMQRLLSFALIICLMLIECILLPLYLNIETIMNLWLRNVPVYAIEFTRYLLIANSISVVNTLFTTVIHATGHIKTLSIWGGTLFLSTLFFSYIVFTFFPDPTLAYLIWVVIMIIVLIVSIWIAQKCIPEMSLLDIFNKIKLPLLAIGITILIMSYMNTLMVSGFWRFAIMTVANLVTLCVVIYVVWVVPIFKGNVKNIIKEFA